MIREEVMTLTRREFIKHSGIAAG
ncbi:twin-arginine translocation signal domain-containing protein, partial [Escherichia coli]|nr:twin-arginine translocation signal domain-containing protein [Escherichia coli]MWM20053.1 twin-arginine translocation signal domain-containing protein [Escherichia coli]HCG18143.1 transcriptional initiation protein Tat [Shigella sp.]